MSGPDLAYGLLVSVSLGLGVTGVLLRIDARYATTSARAADLRRRARRLGFGAMAVAAVALLLAVLT